MSAAAKDPAAKPFARASRKMPAAVTKLTPKATRAPKNRSSSQPVPILPRTLEPPSMDAHNAASRGVIPRSVSKADRCVMAPFMLMELMKRTETMIQKTKVRMPCCRDKGLHKCGSNYPLPEQMNRGYEGQDHA